MWFNIENMPYISLGWIGLGFFILMIGVFVLAYQQSKEEKYTEYDDGQELFSFFLQEEEKKNEAFRESLKNEYKDINKNISHSNKENQYLKTEEALYDEIIKLYKQNIPLEEIAKQMKIGIGEVRLIVSLYSMR